MQVPSPPSVSTGLNSLFGPSKIRFWVMEIPGNLFLKIPAAPSCEVQVFPGVFPKALGS